MAELATSPAREAEDPMVTAHRHNYKFSPLYKLPEELVLMIVKDLHSSKTPSSLAALFCLAHVSRLTRRIILELYGFDWIHMRCSLFGFQRHVSRDGDPKEVACTLLRKDLLCTDCSSRTCGQQNIWSRCKFQAAQGGLLYCSGCDEIHHARQFSKAQSTLGDTERVCIAWEGRLKLCDHHKGISWADLEKRLVEMAAEESDTNRLAFWEKCHHPEHPTCPSGIRSSPELTIYAQDGTLDLYIEWDAHAMIETDGKGRLRSRDVRAVFLNQRRCGISFLRDESSMDTTRWNHPEEMTCFDIEEGCTCLSYGAEGEMWAKSDTDHSRVQGYKACLGRYKHSDAIWASEVDLCDKFNSPDRQCLVTLYDRVMGLGKYQIRHGGDGEARIRPQHRWLHALDPDSYQLDDDESRFGQVWPVCKDPACGNFHRIKTKYFNLGACWYRSTEDWTKIGEGDKEEALSGGKTGEEHGGKAGEEHGGKTGDEHEGRSGEELESKAMQEEGALEDTSNSGEGHLVATPSSTCGVCVLLKSSSFKAVRAFFGMIAKTYRKFVRSQQTVE
ncbi:hypothetical protein QBC40DRAFT_297337 [Triangularia verruculosa]|uniref:F-box domain-containing protein n=1 Tax=Triangularia verruculosa TaxID=2587418 RepID=A0AAN6XFM1_9PEZI|nr:hypothetical protein QBC40DRAFT_297337 [Triangularia verruculosa]